MSIYYHNRIYISKKLESLLRSKGWNVRWAWG